jgi:hypothetical protein
MASITLTLSEEQAVRLESAATSRNMTPAELLAARLIGFFDDPADPFDPRGRCLRERDQELLRRVL